MRNAPREFALDDRGMPESDDYLVALGPRFRWHGDGRARTVRRAWLDTFDWRLYRAGLTLELTSGRGTTELVLTGRDGAVVAAQQAGPAGVRPKWPGLLDVLPVGPLRERLRPVVGVRALLPVARATSTVHGLRVLNSDDKTAARVTVDRMAVSSPAKTTLPPRLTVTALRGYQAQADRLADILAAASGMTDGGAGALAAALAAAGRHPGDDTGKISVQLTRQGSGGRGRHGAPCWRSCSAPCRPMSAACCATSTRNSCMTCASPCGAPGRRSSWPGTCCPAAWAAGSGPSSSGSAT